jgi:hypothetical protein
MDVNQRLAEARTALHRLEIGQAEIEISTPDQGVVKFARAEVGRLRAYISQLEAEKAGRPARCAIKVGF